MSTLPSFIAEESTLPVPQDLTENSTYRFGEGDTQGPTFDTQSLERRARTIEGLRIVHSSENKAEIVKQRWSGVVIDQDNGEISARLSDLTDPSKPDEIVVMSLEEIPPGDVALVAIGAMFFWQIGYRQGDKYPRERFSKITFRRLPDWTEEEVEAASKAAMGYSDFFFSNPA